MFKTNYSFRQAVGTPEEVVAKLKSLGYKYAPIADIESTFGWSKWTEACQEHGLKPVYGVSLYVTPAIQAKKPVLDLWSFYATDDIADINKLVKLATAQGKSLPRVGFTSLIKYDQLKDFPNLIKVSGYKARADLIDFSNPKTFIGLSPSCSKGFLNRARESCKDNFFPMQDARYVEKEDKGFYEIGCGFNADLHTYPQHILSEDEWCNAIEHRLDADEALSNQELFFSQCTATLKKGTLLRYKTEKTLRQMCVEGAERIGINLNDEVYKERLDTELKVIEEKKFEDYFFIVADLMQWARKNMMVGPGRGSSAGSLVCYLLGITAVDPIKYGLLFFRFLDPSRPDWPDIDSDFADRDKAVAYLIERFGSERVAKLGTIAMFQAKNATNEVSKQLGLPRFEFEPVLAAIPKYAAGDARVDKALDATLKETAIGRRTLEKYPNFALAGRLSGTPANSSQHAAGVILTDGLTTDYVAIHSQTQSAMCNLQEAEKLNLLKLDVLGLDTLRIIEQTLEIAGLPSNYLDTIPLDDQKAFDVLNDGKYTGIFQFEGHALRKLASTMRIESLDDLSILSALSRPGASVGADAWVRRRKGQEQVSYLHPLLEPYLKETLGTLVFQETVMLIAHDLAGMSWDKVAKLRKAIGKSMGEEAMQEYAEPFKSGLIAKGIPQDVADKFWNDILGFGKYSFNKSHTIAYGIVGYWTCYLKAYYPVEYAAAALSNTETLEKQIAFLREMQDEGISYVAVDPDLSTDKWHAAIHNGEKKLIGPLSNVKGLGPKMVKQILSARARNEPLPDRAQKLLSKPITTLDSLTPVQDAVSQIDILQHIKDYPTPLKDITPDGTWQDHYCVGVVTVCEERSENDPKKVSDRIARGAEGVLPGDPKYVEIRLKSDDTSNFYCKIGKKDFDFLAPRVLGKVKKDKTLVAIRGTLCPEVPCFLVKGIKIIGELP